MGEKLRETNRWARIPEGRLGVAACRDKKLLVFVDTVGVAQGGVCGGEAGPRRGAAQVGLGQSPQRVALADLNCGGRVRTAIMCYCRRACGGKNEIRAGADLVGIGDARIDGEEFVPPIAAPQILLRQLPERIAGLDADRVLRRNRLSCPCNYGRYCRMNLGNVSGRLNWISDWCRRLIGDDRRRWLHRLYVKAWQRGAEEKFGLRWKR